MDGPRTVAVDELPLFVELANEAYGLPQGRSPGLPALVPRVFAPENLEHLKVIVADDRPAAVAGYILERLIIGGSEVRIALLSLIATRPDLRGQGLASLILDDCLGQMRREGARLLAVPFDWGLGPKLDCHPAGLVWEARLSPGDLPPPGQLALRPVDGAAAVAEMWRLHAAEDPRFDWDEDQFHALVQADACGYFLGYQSRAWLIQREGQPVAYAILGVSTADPSEGRMFEYGGDRRALSSGLRAILARLGLSVCDFHLPHQDAVLLERLRISSGKEWRSRPLPGAMRLLDPVGLWEDLLPGMSKRIGESSASRFSIALGAGGAVNLTMGKEALIIQDQERLAGLILGAGAPPAPERPMPARLRQILSGCFPLPFPLTQGLACVGPVSVPGG